MGHRAFRFKSFIFDNYILSFKINEETSVGELDSPWGFVSMIEGAADA